jgi:hypothetical protein
MRALIHRQIGRRRATCVNRPGASFIRLRNHRLLKLAFGHVGAGERECHPLDIDGHRQGRPEGP